MAVSRIAPPLILGTLATSDSAMLAVTQTVFRSATVNSTSLGSAFWLGTASFLMIVPSNGELIR